MKTNKITLILLLSLLVSSFFHSCRNNEKKIIGRFYSSETFDEEPADGYVSISGLFESIEEFFRDKSYRETFKITYTLSHNQGSLKIYYEGSIHGNWNIEKTQLYYNYDIESFSFDFVRTDATNEESERVNDFNSAFLPELTSQLKEELINASPDPFEIIELNSDKLVTRCMSGEEMVQIRMRK